MSKTGERVSETGNDTLSQLRQLEEQENLLWHRMELVIQRHGMTMATSPSVSGDKVFAAVEDFREVSRVIADGIRQLTSLIHQEVLLRKSGISVEDLDTEVDSILKDRIDFHFKPHEPTRESTADGSKPG